MVPILIVRKTSNSSHQRLKLIRCAARQPARFATQLRAFGYQVIRAPTRRLCTWSEGTGRPSCCIWPKRATNMPRTITGGSEICQSGPLQM
jgi:hypothetical protein